MPGNTFGRLFRVTTWGESHGPALGAVVDGCPPGIELDESLIQAMMDRRRPGRSAASTSRKEPDRVKILSGVFEGKTTGTPLSLVVENQDARSRSYADIANLYRPGHGDYSYDKKYGIRDYRGGGRASARETAARVMAGAVAARLLRQAGIEVFAYTLEMGGVRAGKRDLSVVNENPYGCPDPEAAKAIEARVKEVKAAGDSIGGVVEVVATGVPPGLGEPVFDKLDGALAYALMGIGAVKGVEIGAGFAAARMTGSQNNDPLTVDGFSANNAGGTLAGVSSGQEIVARVAVKPIPSIGMEQKTVDREGAPAVIKVKGRHDVCAIPRINVVCEAMVNLVLADFFLQQRAIGGEFG